MYLIQLLKLLEKRAAVLKMLTNL